jgi:hypothetical protein
VLGGFSPCRGSRVCRGSGVAVRPRPHPMITAMADFGVRDLAGAMVATRRWHNAAPEMRVYHSAKLAALQQALGADLSAAASESSRLGAFALQGLIDMTVMMLAGDRSPFAGFLEAPSEVAMMYRRHGGSIKSAGDALDEALTALLIDLIVEVYQVPNERTVPGHVLREHGFNPEVPEPDPFDYW